MQRLKDKYRRVAGYDESHVCGDCRFFEKIPKEYKRKPRSDVVHHYCTLMGYNVAPYNEVTEDETACTNWRIK